MVPPNSNQSCLIYLNWLIIKVRNGHFVCVIVREGLQGGGGGGGGGGGHVTLIPLYFPPYSTVQMVQMTNFS